MRKLDWDNLRIPGSFGGVLRDQDVQRDRGGGGNYLHMMGISEGMVPSGVEVIQIAGDSGYYRICA